MTLMLNRTRHLSGTRNMGAFLAIGLIAACTGPLDTDNGEEGIATEITTDEGGSVDPVPADAPGVGMGEVEGDAISSDTGQPDLGADSLDGELAPDAEPGMEIEDGADLPANRATE